jgi:hypothetical protein
MGARSRAVNKSAQAANTVGGLVSLAAANPALLRARQTAVDDVCHALQEFTECVRYLKTRRNKGAELLSLDSEAEVQDVLYLILRPWIRDLVYETPTDKVSNRFTIRDFVSRSGRFVLEAKYIRDADHGKNVSKEMHDDIEMYRHHQHCDTLIFFIYDPNSLIPDQGAMRSSIESSRVYDGRALECRLIVKP